MNIFKKNSKPFITPKKKVVTTQNTTEELAVQFLQRTISSINGQLKIEIKRHGFEIDDVVTGKCKIVRSVARSESDPRFVGETFSIVHGDINRIIMAVKWSPSGVKIERNTDQVVEAVKKSPNFGLIKSDLENVHLVMEATEREIEIEARAQQYMKNHLDKKQ